MRRALILSVVVALTTFPGAVAAQGTQRSLIAYEVRVSEGHGEVYVVGSDGSGRRRLTGTPPSLPGQPSDSDPDWAPDGQRLAYVHGPEPRHGTFQMRVRDVTTGADEVLAGGTDGSHPAWSPDGTRIAFVRQDRDRQESSLYVMSSDGTGARKVVDDAFEPAWAPDGRRIAFTRLSAGAGGLYVVNPDGTGLALLARDAASPSFSPDGSRIAFASTRDHNGETCFEDCRPNAELYVMNADGTGQRRLTNTTADEERPSWSPDGMRIAFDSDRNSPESPDGGGHELYSMNADGSCVTWLTNGPAESTGPDWQPGAGLATDPGPLCGAAPRPPTFDVDAAPLARFKRFQAYWLGQTFGNLLLSALVGPDVIYGDCAAYSPGDCGASVQLQNRSVCERNPFTYGRGLAGGVPSRRVRFRGAILAAYPSAGGWDLYAGRTSTTIFGTHLTLRDAEAVVRSLRTARALAPSKRRLPAPAFPAAFWRKLHRFTAAYARLGSAAAVARELRVSTRAARDKLALARMLRGFGARREVRCSRA